MKSRSIDYTLLEKLENLFEKRLKRMSRTAVIRDIVACQVNDKSASNPPAGEFDATRITTPHYDESKAQQETEESVIDRIVLHINNLVMLATLQHLQDNFINHDELLETAAESATNLLKKDPSEAECWEAMKDMLRKKPAIARLKSAKTHHFTRLILNECSLYPNKERGPLSVAGFNTLVEKIKNLASSCPPNLHLVLASAPILIDDTINNMVIFAECGEEPTIRTFTKAIASTVDPCYPNKKRFSYYDIPPIDTRTIPTSSLSKDMGTFFLGGSFPCANGKFNTVIDICIDHKNFVGLNKLTQSITQTLHEGEGILPSLVSHVVVSNAINMMSTSIVSQTKAVTQADPVSFSSKDAGINSTPTCPESVKHLTKPLFGSHTIVSTYPPQALTPHIDALDQTININNEMTPYLYALRQYREQRPAEIIAVQAEIEGFILLTLEKSLLELQRGSNKLFSDSIIAYQLKIRSIINNITQNPFENFMNISALLGNMQNSATMPIKYNTAVTAAKALLENERREFFDMINKNAFTYNNNTPIKKLYKFLDSALDNITNEYFSWIETIFCRFPKLAHHFFQEAIKKINPKKLHALSTHCQSNAETILGMLSYGERCLLLNTQLHPHFKMMLWESVALAAQIIDIESFMRDLNSEIYKPLLHFVTHPTRQIILDRAIEFANTCKPIRLELENKIDEIISLDASLNKTNYILHKINLLTYLQKEFYRHTKTTHQPYVPLVSFDNIINSIKSVLPEYANLYISDETQLDFITQLLSFSHFTHLLSKPAYQHRNEILQVAINKALPLRATRLTPAEFLMIIDCTPDLAIELNSYTLYEIFYSETDKNSQIEFSYLFIQNILYSPEHVDTLSKICNLAKDNAPDIIKKLSAIERNILLYKNTNIEFFLALIESFSPEKILTFYAGAKEIMLTLSPEIQSEIKKLTHTYLGKYNHHRKFSAPKSTHSSAPNTIINPQKKLKRD